MKRRMIKNFLIQFLLVIYSIKINIASDITNNVFGTRIDGIIAAFGDFNSDELTDVFMIRNSGKTLEVFLGADVEPLLRRTSMCEFKRLDITSVVPGDFDGDEFMDLLITARLDSSNLLGVYINWGGSDYLNCTNEDKDPIIKMYGEPLALDYNKDMIIDLFGMDESRQRTFWVFNRDRQQPNISRMSPTKHLPEMSIPHAHAYLDLDNDYTADLFIATPEHFEVWLGLENEGFKYSHKIDILTGLNKHIGQTLFLDIELKGTLNQILPVCFDNRCANSTLLVRDGHNFKDLHVNFKDMENQIWGFVAPRADEIYLNSITLRGGDFNMDGYPDLLVTLTKSTGQPQTFLLENTACDQNAICPLSRTFVVRWRALSPFLNGTIAGAFYDFYQDGILDVILIQKDANNKLRPVAFRNTLDYDANFVKVIVVTGLTNIRDPKKLTPLGRKKRTYGTNLPGPRINYYTTTQAGDIQHGSSIQIPQSAYFSLHLPYTIFGLGRTPNFVDSLTVGLSNRSRTWKQLIPNSQMIVVPWPPDNPNQWKAQLFVTPSKLILMSVIALGGTCLFITFIILILYLKEKRADKLERLQEAHRFHFDAM